MRVIRKMLLADLAALIFLAAIVWAGMSLILNSGGGIPGTGYDNNCGLGC